MSRDRALEVLSGSSLLTGLPRETILAILSRATEKRCPDNAVVFREGEPAARKGATPARGRSPQRVGEKGGK